MTDLAPYDLIANTWADEIITAEIDDPSSRGHFAILARKPGWDLAVK